MLYNVTDLKIIKSFIFLFFAFCSAGVSAAEHAHQEEVKRPPLKMSAGVLPFFDDGRTVLLGKEFRKRYNAFAWMEFGGNQEGDETFAQIAQREANEETADTLAQQITLEHVVEAERNNHYVEYLNPETNMHYRMYCLKVQGEKPSLELFKENAKKPELIENINKSEWQYFDTSAVMASLGKDDLLVGTDTPLYSTMKTRLNMLKEKEFYKEFVNQK